MAELGSKLGVADPSAYVLNLSLICSPTFFLPNKYKNPYLHLRDFMVTEIIGPILWVCRLKF